jgi:predicted nucleic acid-binding protein
MRPITLDPSVAIAGLLFPEGWRRKLVVVAAYGVLSYYEKFAGPDECQLVQREVDAGALAGGVDLRDLVERAGEVKAVLADALPPMTPDDLCLVSSRPLLDELERKMAEPRLLRRVPALSASEAPALVRRQMTAVTAIMVPDFEPAAIPEYTEGRDRKDDYVIHTALSGDAYAVVSDDRKHIALTADEPTVYRSESGASVRAFQLQPFVEEEVNTLHFSLDDVDGTLLRRFHELLNPYDVPLP